MGGARGAPHGDGYLRALGIAIESFAIVQAAGRPATHGSFTADWRFPS
jgi:hypothetical protein